MKTNRIAILFLIVLFVALPLSAQITNEDLRNIPIEKLEAMTKEAERKAELIERYNRAQQKIADAVKAPSSVEPAPAAPITSPPAGIGTPVTVRPSAKIVPAATLNKAAPQDPQSAKCFGVKLDEVVSNYEKAICFYAVQLTDRTLDEPERAPFVSIDEDKTPLGKILGGRLSKTDKIKKNVVEFLVGSEAKRTDKQEGGDPKTSGSTSLVVKGGVPDFLNAAMEDGAVEGTISGNTVTVRANPVGFFEWLGTSGYSQRFRTAFQTDKQQVEAMFKRDSPFVKFMRNTSIGLSFDVSRGVETPAFTGTRQQLSAVSVRHQFFNRRDPRHSVYRDEWNKFMQENGDKYLDAMVKNWDKITNSTHDKLNNAPLQKLIDEINKSLAGLKGTTESRLAVEEKIQTIIRAKLDALNTDDVVKDEAFMAALNSSLEATVSYIGKKKELLDKISKGDVFSVEYTNYREVTAPDTSNFRAIYSNGLGDGWDLTFNGSLTIYNKLPLVAAPARIRRVRDFDLAFQVEKQFNFIDTETILNSSFTIGDPVVMIAGKYQRLNSDVFLPDGTVKTGTAGDNAYVQGKMVIPVTFGGITMKIPFSVTWANRTDLIKESHIRGNFGITMDINPFMQKLKNSLFGGLFDR